MVRRLAALVALCASLILGGCSGVTPSPGAASAPTEPPPRAVETPTPSSSAPIPSQRLNRASDNYIAGWNDGTAGLGKNAELAGDFNYDTGYREGVAEAAKPWRAASDEQKFLRWLDELGVKVQGREEELVNAGRDVCLADPSDYWSLQEMNDKLVKRLRDDYELSTKEARAVLGGARVELKLCKLMSEG